MKGENGHVVRDMITTPKTMENPQVTIIIFVEIPIPDLTVMRLFIITSLLPPMIYTLSF